MIRSSRYIISPERKAKFSFELNSPFELFQSHLPWSILLQPSLAVLSCVVTTTGCRASKRKKLVALCSLWWESWVLPTACWAKGSWQEGGKLFHQLNKLPYVLSKQVPLLHSWLFQCPPSSPSLRTAGPAGEDILGQTLFSAPFSPPGFFCLFFFSSPSGLRNNSPSWTLLPLVWQMYFVLFGWDERLHFVWCWTP